MDVLGVHHNQVMKITKKQIKRDRKEMKVKYICSPLKVQTSASNFRALVQQLTGQDSNVAEAVVNGENVREKVETQQWRVDINEAYMLEADSWFNPNYSEFKYSSSLLEPLSHQQLECNF